jgi:hypothetical protein
MATHSARAVVYYVAQDGNDRWSGTRATVKRDKSDGPFATIERAQRAARKHLRAKQAPTVRLEIRAGTYFLKKPLVLDPRDSGWFSMRKFMIPEEHHPMVYAAYKGERAVISGGRAITGWKVGEHNGRTVWTVKLPAVKRGAWTFQQLWVNGERRYRPQLPKKGEYRSILMDANWEGAWNDTVRKGQNRFGYEPGHIDPDWRNIEDIEVEFRTLWVCERANLERVDGENRVACLDRTTNYRLSHDFHNEGAPYVIHNVFEALDTPGEWYLDRPTGTLYYLPKKGEDPETAEVVAPVLEHVLRIEGTDDAPVSTVRFEGLAFAHNGWDRPKKSDAHQGAVALPGLVHLKRAENVAFERCRIGHTGGYGVHAEDRSLDLAFRRCELTDLGAGGIKVMNGCERTLVEDCHIHHGGLVDRAGSGVLIQRCSGNRILHNHIHDLYWIGVCVGWCWNYGRNGTFGNVVEWNHIHDIGKGMLSDMAGIYTLGVQPGTRVRYNHVHHVHARGYGGSGIYPDEGSSYVLIESNLVHDTCASAFYQHYGKENLVRNNIFAFDASSHVMCQWGEEHVSFFFENNIVYLGAGRLMHTKGNWAPQPGTFRDNLYYSPKGGGALELDGVPLKQLKEDGVDVGGKVANPKFRDPAKRDFRLAADSPALKMGFVPWDYRACGPRKEDA